MLSVEGVELRVVRGAVLWPIPPAPVTSLRGEQGFLRPLQALFRWRFCALVLTGVNSSCKGFTRVPQQFPGSHVFLAADPDVEICVDPRGRENTVRCGYVGRRRDGFGSGQGAEILVVADPAIKLTQKLPAIARVIFPSIFAVQKEANGQGFVGADRFAQMPEPSMQIGRAGDAVHAAVDKADQVA